MKRHKFETSFKKCIHTRALLRGGLVARLFIRAGTALGVVFSSSGIFCGTSFSAVAVADSLFNDDREALREDKVLSQTFVDYLELDGQLLLSENLRDALTPEGSSFVEESLKDQPQKKQIQKIAHSKKLESPESKGLPTRETDRISVSETGEMTGEIFPEVDLSELLASRNRFREFLLEDESQVARLDARFLGTLASADKQFNEAELLQMVALPQKNAGDNFWANSKIAQARNSDTRLKSDKTYTVQNGKIVEVSVDHDESAFSEQAMTQFEVVTDAAGVVRPGTVVDLSEQNAFDEAAGVRKDSLASDSGVAVARNDGFLPQSSANVFSDFSLSENAPSITSATGQMVRGRVNVPKGFDARSVILRVAGTAVQTYPDQDGFFEIGPFSLGSSFELLVFDEDSRLNRRIIPFFVSERMREREIKLMASQDIATLVKSFGAFHMATRSGFCGTVVVFPDQWNGLAEDKVTTKLVDSEGRTRKLYYYSAQGLPSTEQQLSFDGRVCSFNLEKGLYKLYVNFGNLRRSFFLHLHDSTFENSMRFDMTATAYVQSMALSLVDEEVAVEMADEHGVKPVSMSRPLQNFWLTDQGKSIWTPSIDYSLVTDDAYAPLQVYSLGTKNYFPLGDDLLEVRDANSGTFELIGSDVVQQAGAQGRKFSHHLLSEDLVRDLRNLGATPASQEDFLLFGDIDTSRFVSGAAEVSRMVITDFWTGNRVMGVTLIGSAQNRILRFIATGLESGSYNFGIYGTGNRLLWSSIVRAVPSSTQIISNRNN